MDKPRGNFDLSRRVRYTGQFLNPFMADLKRLANLLIE